MSSSVVMPCAANTQWTNACVRSAPTPTRNMINTRSIISSYIASCKIESSTFLIYVQQLVSSSSSSVTASIGASSTVVSAVVFVGPVWFESLSCESLE